MKTHKNTLNSLVTMNNQAIEKEKMNELYGGAGFKPFPPLTIGGAVACTADTFTVTPSGSHNDGDDSWEGECGGSIPPK